MRVSWTCRVTVVLLMGMDLWIGRRGGAWWAVLSTRYSLTRRGGREVVRPSRHTPRGCSVARDRLTRLCGDVCVYATSDEGREML